jgi:uncharacterized protein
MRLRKMLLALAVFATPGGASGQAFDCAAAYLPAEMAICGDDMLAALDEELAADYAALVARAPDWAADRIRTEQEDWLRLRNDCGFDPQCVAGAYRSRMMDFGAWRDRLSR